MTSKSSNPSPADTKDVEETASFAPTFGPDGLIPVTVTSATTGEVLMLAYMNAEALTRTIERRIIGLARAGGFGGRAKKAETSSGWSSSARTATRMRCG
jgi:hypothetical protein